MKRVLIFSITVTIVAVVFILGIQYTTQAQREEGNPGMFDMKSQIMNELETSWTYLSLDMNITDEQLIKARLIYKESWIKYKELADKSEQESGDRETMQSVRAELDKFKSKRNEKLRDILSREEMQKLTEFESKSLGRNQRRIMLR